MIPSRNRRLVDEISIRGWYHCPSVVEGYAAVRTGATAYRELPADLVYAQTHQGRLDVCHVRGEPVSDRVFRNFINGESADSADGQMMDLVNPTTGEVYAQAANSTAEDVDRAFQAAATAFESWRDSTPSRAFTGAAEDRRRHRGACRRTGRA